MEKKSRGGAWGVVFAALLAACAYRGGDDPVALRLSWFDYLNGGDLAEPWRGTTETVHLRASDMTRLRRATTAGGVFTGAPMGLRLESNGFFWTVAACVGGRFIFNAYRWPSPRFEDAAFPALLIAWDPTGVAVNEPRQIIEVYDKDDVNNARRYTLDVGDNGLVGVQPLF